MEDSPIDECERRIMFSFTSTAIHDLSYPPRLFCVNVDNEGDLRGRPSLETTHVISQKKTCDRTVPSNSGPEDGLSHALIRVTVWVFHLQLFNSVPRPSVTWNTVGVHRQALIVIWTDF
jgi:hypothetical protein